MTINNSISNSANFRGPKQSKNGRSEQSLPSLADELGRKLAKLQKIGRDVGAFVNGFQLKVDRDNGAVQINLRKKTRPLVELSPLLQHVGEIAEFQAVIGWDGTQRPMHWSAEHPVRHLLISGAAHSGKTGLLRSLILTLVLATKPAKLQLALIDGSCKGTHGYDHSELKNFNSLPHLLNRPPANPAEVAEIVTFLAKEADHRLANQTVTPQILLIIDNLQDILPVAGPEFHQHLEHILDIGPHTGIAVIMATNRPEDGRLQDLISGIHIDRITGKVQSAGQAAFASGRDDSEAEHLDGNGDFLATLGDKGHHFHAAWVTDRQLDRYLNMLDQPKPALLAWSLNEFADDYHNDQQDTFVEQDQDQDQFIVEPQPAEVIYHDQRYESFSADGAQADEAGEAFEEEVLEEEAFLKEEIVDEPEQDFQMFENQRSLQLENIYTKLNQFWQGSDQDDEAEFDSDEEWEDAEEPADSSIFYEKIEDELADPAPPTLHEQPAVYAPQPKPADPEPDDDLDDENRAEAADENHNQFDPQVEPVQSYTRVTRRSRPSQPKPKPKPKEIQAKTVSEQRSAEADEESQLEPEPPVDEPFDPWQAGLDDDTPSDESEDGASETGFKRPPRLAKRTPPTIRRRVPRPPLNKNLNGGTK